MEKKEQPIKRNPVSDTDLKEEILDQWDPVKDAKEAEEIQRNLEAVPDTEEWNPTEEKFQALMQKARERGFHISSDEEADVHTDDFDDSKKEDAKEKTKKETTITYPASRRAAGWWRKKAMQWTAVAAVTAIGIFGVSMTSQANRAYVMREVNKVFGNDVNTELDNDKVVQSDRTEEYAKETIENTFKIKTPRFFYLPQGVEYHDFFIDDTAQTAFIQYAYNGQMMYLQIFANEENASGIVQSDNGKLLGEIVNDFSNDIKIQIWEVNVDEDEKITYIAKWKYLNTYYELSGKIDREELEKIVKKIMY